MTPHSGDPQPQHLDTHRRHATRPIAVLVHGRGRLTCTMDA